MFRVTTLMCILGCVLLACACQPTRHVKDQLSSAALLYENHDYAKAIPLLQNFTRQYPDSANTPKALYLLADCYHQLGQLQDFNATTDLLAQRYAKSIFSSRAQLIRATDWLRSGESARATALLTSWLTAETPIEIKTSAAELLASQAETAHDWIAAARFYQMLVSIYTQPAERAKAAYLLACAFNAQHAALEAKKAIAQALQLVGEDKPDWLAQAYRLFGDLRLADNQVLQALELYADGMDAAHDSDQTHELRLRIHSVIERLDDNSLTLLEKKNLRNWIRGEVDLRRAMVLRQTDQLTAARELLEQIIRNFPSDELSQAAEGELVAIRSDLAVVPNRLGVLLPLSGRIAVFGQSALQGIQLAQLQERDAGHEFELIVKDSKGQPDNTSRLMEELITQDNVIGIIGPLLSNSLLQSIPIAEKYQVPIFSPGAAEAKIPDGTRTVFRNCVTNDVEGRTIADFSASTLGISTFAILYPDTAYGKGLRDIFSQRISELGAQVVATISYAEGETDFRQYIATLKRYQFEGLFIPDYAKTIGAIAPQLPVYDIMDVVLLGTSGWNSNDLITIGGRYVEGACFTEPYFQGDMNSGADEFATNYQKTFLESPTLVSVQSYEVASILFSLLNRGCRTRRCLVESLRSTPEFPCLTGKLRNTKNGDLQRDVAILIVNHGEITRFQ